MYIWSHIQRVVGLATFYSCHVGPKGSSNDNLGVNRTATQPQLSLKRNNRQMAPNPTRWGKNFATQNFESIGIHRWCFFRFRIQTVRFWDVFNVFNENSHQLLLQQNSVIPRKRWQGIQARDFSDFPKQHQGNDTLHFKDQVANYLHQSPHLLESSPHPCFCRWISSLAPPKIIGKTRSKKGLRIFPCYHPAGKKSWNHFIWQGFTSYPLPMILQFFQGIWTRCLYPWLPATSTLERALARAKGEIPLSLALQPTTSRPLRLSGCEF